MPLRKAIFVVDDDPSMRRSMKRLLREHGFDVMLFDSASGLLGHGDYSAANCIILDINLTEQSGVDLRIRLAQHGLAVPVIYITGNDSQANRSAAIESGCVAYLMKPFTAKSLFDAIERAGVGAG